MIAWRSWTAALVTAGLAACAAAPPEETIEDLGDIEADLETVPVEESVDDAEESYRRYLQNSPDGADTPEAMRRMADLQIEKAKLPELQAGVYYWYMQNGGTGTETGQAAPMDRHRRAGGGRGRPGRRMRSRHPMRECGKVPAQHAVVLSRF